MDLHGYDNPGDGTARYDYARVIRHHYYSDWILSEIFSGKNITVPVFRGCDEPSGQRADPAVSRARAYQELLGAITPVFAGCGLYTGTGVTDYFTDTVRNGGYV